MSLNISLVAKDRVVVDAHACGLEHVREFDDATGKEIPTVQGNCAFVEGFFRNNIFYECDHSPIRTGFVDAKSRLFYRHGSSLAEQHFRIDLVGKLIGLTLLATSGSRYLLVEDDD